MIINIFLTTTKSKEKASGINAKGYLFRKDFLKLVTLANLLYFIVKDHAFIDGNKRIAASIFLYFMNFYGLLYRDGKTCISNNTLAALTLLIAESKADEKELIIDVVMNIVFG